jgi:two-component system cell cycle sensor histidine kinase/response regulator CckA
VQPADVLRDVAQLLRGTFPKTIAIETDWPARLPPVEADPTNLHQAILNLCVNARDAMPEGGRLRLAGSATTLTPVQRTPARAAAASAWIAIAVTDTGTGIAPELREKIFEPFFTTKESGRGTGLGLATVQGIAHSHGGFVEVESTPGAGSTFTLFLPAQTALRSSDTAPSVAVPPRGHGEMILLVDDEPAVLQTTSRLMQAGGYTPCVAASGAEALQLHARHAGEIRAVLTDLMMPGMDGIALARALRETTPGLPIAVMTGLLNQANRDSIAAHGFRGTLAKPFRAEELLWCLHRLVQPK